VIYGLTITRHLDFGVPARPPVGVNVLPQTKAIPPAASSNPGTNSGTTGTPKPPQTGTTQPGATGPRLQDQTGPRPKPSPEPEMSAPRVKLQSDPEPFVMRPRMNSELELIDAPPSSKMPVSFRMLETVSTDKRRAEIEAKLAKIPTENHFEVLGIREDASVLEIRDAYFGMARIFHPDRLTDLPDLRTKAQSAFSRISAAYNELSDDKRRAAYVAKLKADDDKSETKAGTAGNTSTTAGHATIGRAVNAAFEAQKAELFLKKNEFPAAETHAKMAALADPDQPSYTALLVWIQAQQRIVPPLEEGKMSPIFDDLIATLDQLLRKEPTFERALFYRAVLLQRSGQIDRAFKDFSSALELNPRNIDAAREVRLYKLRHKTEETPPNNSGGGLFGRLFKR
jgi:DnaJ-domain-containing protein 1